MIDGAHVVLTDSGGLQEETSALGVPCVTVRNNTERPMTISHGSNILVGEKTVAGIVRATGAALRKRGRAFGGDGRAGERIAGALA